MPRKDGREVLEEIKSARDLKSIPVIVLTASGADEDIVDTCSLQANCYVTKPLNLDQLVEVIPAIESLWFSVVELPRNAAE